MSSQEATAKVREEALAQAVAWNTGNIDTYKQHWYAGGTGFFLDGGLLTEFPEDWSGLKAQYDAGFKPNVEVRHLNVKIYDSTAIITGYAVGTVTFPGDITIEGTWRWSQINIQHEGQWKVVHYHMSPLTPIHSQG